MEIWKDISRYNGKYQVSNMGNIRSVTHLKNGGVLIKPLKPTHDQKGYMVITFCINGKRQYSRVHREVALEFLPRIKGKDVINHKNCIKDDNRVANLEWTTQKENMIHAAKHGCINERPVVAIKDGKYVKAYRNIHEAARDVNGSSANINAYLKARLPNCKHVYGYQWRYLKKDFFKK